MDSLHSALISGMIMHRYKKLVEESNGGKNRTKGTGKRANRHLTGHARRAETTFKSSVGGVERTADIL